MGDIMQTIADMQKKEVINICDGKRLGYVCDVEFDICKGVITAIRVPAASKFFGVFGKAEDYVIPWDCIKKIGDDIVLVEAQY